MRVSVLIPYSTNQQVQSSSSSTVTAHSRPQSPKTAFHSPLDLIQQQGRRGSMGGIFSLQQYYRNSPSPPSTLGLVRRRTVFGENNSASGWGVRGVVCPEELVDAVDSSVDASVTIQTTLSPLPLSRPLVVIVPIMAAPVPPLMPPSAKADSTPSARCFPATPEDRLPVISPLDRALAHLRRAKRELEELAEDLSQIVLLVYSNNEHVSGNVSAAALEQGAKGILTPPFTPDAVLGTFATALNVNAADITPTSTGAMRKDSMGDGSLFATLAQYTLPATSQTQLGSLRLPSSLLRGSAAHTPVRSTLPASVLGSPGSMYHHFKPLPPLPLITPRSSLSQQSQPTTSEVETKADVDTKVESAPVQAVPRSQLKPESPAATMPVQPLGQDKATTPEPSPKAESPTPTPTPSLQLQQPRKSNNARLLSALPLAADFNQPPPSTQKSLPPLSPLQSPKDLAPSPTTPSSPAKPALTSSISMSAAVSAIAPPFTQSSDPFYDFTFVGPRRKSVDTGGLALALKASSDDCLLGPGSREWTVSAFGPGAAVGGWGWGGWEPDSTDGPLFAELLSDMYVHTQNTTDEALVHFNSSLPLHRSTRRHLIHQLSRWDFEPHNLSSDELLECAYIVFEALFRVEGMSADSQFPVEQLETQFRPFISAVRSIYHSQNKYHNFQHAIDVLQAVYSFLVQAECVPPLTILLEGETLQAKEGELLLPLPSGSGPFNTSGNEHGMWSRKERRSTLIQQVLDNRDLFALCIAALGHDVGHPGLSNAFMKNARTPLSVVYDDKSTLEQMHCALLLQLMRKHGLGHLIATSSEIAGFAALAAPCHSSEHGHGFKSSDATEFRKTLIETVLITDMSLHFGWIAKLGQLAKDVEKGEALAKNSATDVKMLVCQALIKCGDISNPTRPHAVSEHWSSALLEEWSCQAMLERELGLPLSVAASADEVTQAKGQIGFIDLFTKPLFDTASSVIPSMEVFARQGDINRAQWQQRLDKCVAAAESAAPRVVAPVRHRRLSQDDDHFRSVFPLSLPASLLSPLSTPSPAGPPYGSGWPTRSVRTPSPSTPPNEEEEPESNTPTMPPLSAPPIGYRREGRQQDSVSSGSSMAASSPSPFSPGALGDSSSTAASSPASHGRSILSSDGGMSFPSSASAAAPDGQPNPVRAAYNASVRKKKSFHRISWDPQRRKVEIPPPVPNMPPEHLTP